MDSHWRTNANCIGKHDLFFGGRGLAVTAERANEDQCKQVCQQCTVIDDCFAYAVGISATELTPGVYGGANRWEREWTASATDREIEQLRHLYSEHGHVGAQQIRAAVEQAGPPDRTHLDGRSASAVAREYGVPVRTAANWYAHHDDIQTGRIEDEPDSIRQRAATVLADNADLPWGELVSQVARAVPRHKAQRRAETDHPEAVMAARHELAAAALADCANNDA